MTDHPHSPGGTGRSATTVIGWLWVVGQLVVFAVVFLPPPGEDWQNPPWLSLSATVIFGLGLVLVAVAALGLGRGLTPTPVPRHGGQLVTGGLYRFVRHPIYTGVLLIILASTVRSQSFLQLLVAVLALLFFDRKAAWEERALAERYDGYPAYAAGTAKFFPGLW
jgi:protein-S-isoprenylcysteine O-methyltransferase Ste14